MPRMVRSPAHADTDSTAGAPTTAQTATQSGCGPRSETDAMTVSAQEERAAIEEVAA